MANDSAFTRNFPVFKTHRRDPTGDTGSRLVLLCSFLILLQRLITGWWPLAGHGQKRKKSTPFCKSIICFLFLFKPSTFYLSAKQKVCV